MAKVCAAMLQFSSSKQNARTRQGWHCWACLCLGNMLHSADLEASTGNLLKSISLK